MTTVWVKIIREKATGRQCAKAITKGLFSYHVLPLKKSLPKVR